MDHGYTTERDTHLKDTWILIKFQILLKSEIFQGI